MTNKPYKVIKSDKFGSYYNPRYIVVSTETGEVLDDAQGYGYKSVQNAYAAYGYKNRTPEQKKKSKKEYGVVREWIRQNKEAFVDIKENLLDAWFQTKKIGEEVTTELELHWFKHELQKHNLTLPDGITLFKAHKLMYEIKENK